MLYCFVRHPTFWIENLKSQSDRFLGLSDYFRDGQHQKPELVRQGEIGEMERERV